MQKTIFHLFKRKELPDFWNTYVESLKDINKKDIEHSKFVVFDCETSGLNPSEDRILSIGAITINHNEIEVSHTFEYYLEQEVFNKETVAIHGLLKDGNQQKHTEAAAIQKFIQYIEGAILVGHHVGFDIACVNHALKRIGLPKLKNKSLDTGILFKRSKHEIYNDVFNKNYTLDAVCDELNIPKKDRHTACGDAYITAIVFFRILGKLNKNKNMKLKDLLFVPKSLY